MKQYRVASISLGILAAIAVGVVLDLAQTVIIPLVIAVLLSFILEPIIRFLMKRLKFPRLLAIILVILTIFGFFYLIGLFVYNSAQSFVREYPNYLGKFQKIFYDINQRYLGRLDIPDDLLGRIDWSGAIRETIVSWSGSFVGFLGVLFIILIFLFFLFLENPMFKRKLKAAFPLHSSRRIGIIMEHIIRQVSRYLSVKFFISALTGFLIWLSLTIIDVDFPLIWATLGFFLNFIPNIGSFIVSAVIILVSFIQFYPALGRVAAVAVSMITIQTIVGSILDPKLQGDRLNLSPVIILFSLLFWGWLWGVVGAILSIPITATIKIILENVPNLKPVGVLMGTGHKVRRRHLFLKKRSSSREKPSARVEE
ncbi:MAG: AI-2E family transporter [bacterium]